MRLNFKKNKKSSLVSSLLFRAGAIAVLAVVVWLVITDVKIYFRKKQLGLQIQNMQHKIEGAKKENEDLRHGIANKDNPAYVEEVAREELDLQKPGEKVVSFVMQENQAETPDQQNAWPWLGWMGQWFSW